MKSRLGFLWDAWRWVLEGWIGERSGEALRSEALPLPQERYLEGSFLLPPVRRAQLDAQIAQRLFDESPLAPERAVLGWRVEPDWEGWRVDWIVTERGTVAEARKAANRLVALVAANTTRGAIAFRDEVWQQMQRQRIRVQRRRVLLFVLLCAALLVAFLSKPWQEWRATQQATAFAVELERRVQPVQAALAALRAAEAREQALRQVASVRRDWVGAWEAISRLMPDGAWLDRWDQQGAQVRIVGVTPSVTQLLAALEQEPGFAEVKTPLATTRDGRTGFERFVIEFQWQEGAE